MEDKIMRFLAYDGKISVVCANTTNLVEKARKIHDLSPLATATFGRLLTITSIMAQEMKSNKDKILIISQTTYSLETFENIVKKIKKCRV